MSGRKYATLRDRLNANSKEMRLIDHDPERPWTEQPCRIWTSALDTDGYGFLTLRMRLRYKFGQFKGQRIPKRRKAHRVSLADYHGIPLHCLNHCAHYCDNRPCIEPTHLRSTTNYQNVRDRMLKGRTRNGLTGPLPENVHLYKAAA